MLVTYSKDNKLIEDVRSFLVGIAIGIRFRANFSIEDKLGTIIDSILYSKCSTFDSVFFPEVLTGPLGKKLINKETGNSLSVDPSNIILDMRVNEFDLEKINQIHERFNKEIIQNVLQKFEVTRINRIGYINRYIFDVEELSRVFISKTIGQTLQGVNGQSTIVPYLRHSHIQVQLIAQPQETLKKRSKRLAIL